MGPILTRRILRYIRYDESNPKENSIPFFYIFLTYIWQNSFLLSSLHFDICINVICNSSVIANCNFLPYLILEQITVKAKATSAFTSNGGELSFS